MKTRKFLRVITLCLILAMCFAVPVSAAEKSTTTETPTAAAVGPVVTSPSIDMQKITVRPYYVDQNGKKQTMAGYYYNRTGNYGASISCKVTAAQKAEMEQTVANAGQVQAGWQIKIDFKMSGSFKSGGVITRSPANTPTISVSPGFAESATFYTTVDNPDFNWDAYFAYVYNNKYLTQLMSASVTFMNEQ